jgi:putative SOS response-associated peptidase YedK
VSSPMLLAERFDVDEIAVPEPPEPDYNVAPRQEVLAVVPRRREDEDGAAVTTRVLEQLRWGLVPSWADDPRIGDRLINARAESVAEKAAFKTAFRKRRCIMPADGFYEWERAVGGKKKPVFVHRRDGEPIAFAGLWEVWKDHSVPDAPWLLSCALVTTRANAVMEPVHDRMPVLLPESAWGTWLDPAIEDRAELEQLLVPAPDDEIELWPVSTRVNSADTNGPDLVERVEPDTLF